MIIACEAGNSCCRLYVCLRAYRFAPLRPEEDATVQRNQSGFPPADEEMKLASDGGFPVEWIGELGVYRKKKCQIPKIELQ